MASVADIERALYRLQVTKYGNAASLMVLVYDYFLTFDCEITLVWNSSWGVGKIIYFLARYSALVDTPWALWLVTGIGIPVERCHNVYAPAIWVAVFGIASAEAILFLRTSALYGNARKVSISLVLVWLSILISCIIITSLWLRTVSFGPAPFSVLGGCYQISGTRLIYANYVLLLFQETVIVLLTIYRALGTGVRSHDRLVLTLYRDGFFHFFYLFIIAVGNIILLAIGPPELLELIAPFQRVMHAILSTRVLLHARGAARDKEVTVTDLRFAVSAMITHGRVTTSTASADVEQHLESDDSTSTNSKTG